MTKKLSTRTFIFSQIFILILGLGFVFGLNYLMNPSKATQNRSLYGAPVTTAPASLTLEVSSPDDDLLVFNQNLVVTGKTLPKLNVLISTETSDLVVEAKSDGSFSGDLVLTPGVNEITVAVFDDSGDQREIKKTVFYSKEKI